MIYLNINDIENSDELTGRMVYHKTENAIIAIFAYLKRYQPTLFKAHSEFLNGSHDKDRLGLMHYCVAFILNKKMKDCNIDLVDLDDAAKSSVED